MSKAERRRTRVSSTIDKLPDDIKGQLDVRLADTSNTYEELAAWLKAEGYDLWIYSGYLFEDLIAGHPHEKAPDLLALCDVLVDGPFVEALHSYDLNWAGSSNQRVIDLPATLKSGEMVLWKQDTIDFEAPSSW